MIQTIPIAKSFETAEALKVALEALVRQHRLMQDNGTPYLLAHADDGVIWGRFDDGSLTTAADVFRQAADAQEVVVELRPKTLQQARLFGTEGEILIWKDNKGFTARLLNEEHVPADDILPNEDVWLWGTGMEVEGVAAEANFTLMHEGLQGLRHAPPVVQAIDQRYGLRIRHQLNYDDRGQAYIAYSRLVNLVRVREDNNGSET